jgi:hypothetical protein
VCDDVSIVAVLEGSKVSELQTESVYFRTGKGAKVGDELSVILGLHPDATIAFGTEEGPWLSATIPDSGSFSFQVDRSLLERLDHRRIDRALIAHLRAALYLASGR